MNDAAGRALDLVRAGLHPGSGAVGAASWAECAREGLGGLLYARAVGAGAWRGPDAWRVAHRATAARNLQILGAFAAVTATLEAEPLLLPGAALLRLYPDLGCRPMDDVDVLAPPGQKAAVLTGLRRAGLCATERQPDLMRRADLTVDVHGDPLNCDRIRARRRAGWLDPASAWQGRRRVDLEGRPVWVLSLEDEVLYTAAHALRHSYRRLTWLLDLYLQLRVPELDWDRLRSRAEVTGLVAPLDYGLWYLDGAGAALPAAGRAWVARTRLPVPTARVLAWVLGNRATTCVGEVLWCLTCPLRRDRLRLLAEFAFPRTDVLLQVFPGLPRRLACLGYVLRCGQVLVRGAVELGALWRRAGGGEWVAR